LLNKYTDRNRLSLPAGSVVSARDLNLIWDLWTIDEDWAGGIAAKDDLSNEANNTMQIDWVRTWQLVEE